MTESIEENMNYFVLCENAKAYVRKTVSHGELLAQLAEESTELAHAALKMRRVITGDNPTPVSKGEALAAIKEEIADVELLIELLDVCDNGTVEAIKNRKILRWQDRLEEAEK